jgi:phenylacetate-CoA ligase
MTAELTHADVSLEAHVYAGFVRNVLFPLHEWLKGHQTVRILKEMEAAESLTTSELEQLQRAKLRDFIDYCFAHVPYVRMRMQEAGIAPSEIQNTTDLPMLPLMRKADVRAHRESLRSDIAGRLTPIATGGSTGEPLICDLSKRRIAARVACRQRASRWWGVSVGDPEFALWGSPIELNHQDRIRAIRDTLLATKLLPAFEMDESAMSRYLDVIERRGCRQVFGYPSAIYLLCVHAQKHRRSLRRLGVKVVFVTGEVVLPYQRELISETFNAPVSDGYGGRDSGGISFECPQGGMHIMADAVIVEIVDPAGRPVPRGEAGEIVVTDLYSHEAPFIRYATGDAGTLSKRSCNCGRSLPLFEKIEGRANDLIVAPDGRLINSLALIYPVREIGGIEHFRILQRAVDRFHVEIVRSADYRTQDEEQIRERWTKLLRSSIHVTFDYLPSLRPERSGKFRHVVSEVMLQQTSRSTPAEPERSQSRQNPSEGAEPSQM